jgi:chaperonin GroEL
MKKKLFLKGSEAKKKLLEGINIAADIVKSTIGPSGKNVFIMKNHLRPIITNDGISVLHEIDLEDKFQDAGVRILLDAAYETDEKAGDGTTTATVLAQAIIKSVFEYIGYDNPLVDNSELKVMEVYRQLEEDKNTILSVLEQNKQLISDHQNLIDVASASMEDKEIGKIIADAVSKVGEDGFIKIEENNENGVKIDVVEGMQFDGCELAASFMPTEVSEPVILVTNEIIENASDLISFASLLNKRTGVIVAQGFSQDVVVSLAQASTKGINIVAVKTPGLIDEELEDLSLYVGAKFINKKIGIKFDNIDSKIGSCSKFIINKTGAAFIGSDADMSNRLKEVKDLLQNEKKEQFIKRYQKRIGRLSGGVVFVYVGANTEPEKKYLKLKIEDAINATQMAMKGGFVKGGGLALKEIAEGLEDNNLLKEPIQSPYNAIQKNAGGNLEIGSHIIDPFLVTKTALDSAVSVAKALITADYVIVEEEDTAAKKLVETLTNTK